MLSKEAVHFLMQEGIKPINRHIKLVDSLGNKRDIFIDNEGIPHEVNTVSYKANTLRVSTLTSLVDYLHNKDRTYSKFYIHVEDERTVSVLSNLDAFGERERLITAVADVPYFEYEHFHESEEL